MALVQHFLMASSGKYLRIITVLTTARAGPDGLTPALTTRFPGRAPQSGAEGLSIEGASQVGAEPCWTIPVEYRRSNAVFLDPHIREELRFQEHRWNSNSQALPIPTCKKDQKTTGSNIPSPVET